MNKTRTFYVCLLSLALIGLNGCAATQTLNSNAEKLSKNYQPIKQLEAYMDSNKNLHLCIDLLKSGASKVETISQQIPWSDFKRMSFSPLFHHGAGKYLLDARQYTTGCKRLPDFTSIPITIINIDNEIKGYNELYDYVSNLPAGNTEYSLYLLHSNKLKRVSWKCERLFGTQDCHEDLSYSWPRLVIKATPENRPPAVTISILAGHTGEKRGVKPVEFAKAASIDLITFPIQLIIGGLYMTFGAH